MSDESKVDFFGEPYVSGAAPTVEREQELVTLHGRSILIHHGLYSVQIVERDDEDARFVADCAKSLLASYKSSVLQEVRKQDLELVGLLDECRSGVEGNLRRMRRELEGAKGILAKDALNGAIASCENTLVRIDERLALLDRMEGK